MFVVLYKCIADQVHTLLEVPHLEASRSILSPNIVVDSVNHLLALPFGLISVAWRFIDIDNQHDSQIKYNITIIESISLKFP